MVSEMKGKTINIILIAAVLILISFSAGVKIHSLSTFSEISDWNYQQLDQINSTKNNFSFIVLGDNKNSVTVFEKLIEKVNKEDAIFAIDIGDLVFNGEKHRFNFFINQIKTLNKPLLTAIGNHELMDEGRGNYYDMFGRFYYSFTVGENYFIVLDDANSKNIGSWQMNWLENKLQKSTNYSNRFVFMHVPLFDPRNGERAEGHSIDDLEFANELNGLFDEYNVTMLFCSNIHAYYNGTWGRTPYIITGGAGAELVGNDPNHDFFHYIKVNVSEDGIKYEVVKLKGSEFEIMARWTYTVWLYIYAFFDINGIYLFIALSWICLGYYIIFVKKKWLIWNYRKKK